MAKKVQPELRLLTISALIISLLAAACTRSPSATISDDYTATGTDGLTAAFLGQDGNSVAGRLCASGTAKDNVHIHLSGLLTNTEPVSFRVEDFSGGGLWATPCDPVSNWFLYVELVKDNETNLFFKPFRDAPKGTEYRITVIYSNGNVQTVTVSGSRIQP